MKRKAIKKILTTVIILTQLLSGYGPFISIAFSQDISPSLPFSSDPVVPAPSGTPTPLPSPATAPTPTSPPPSLYPEKFPQEFFRATPSKTPDPTPTPVVTKTIAPTSIMPAVSLPSSSLPSAVIRQKIKLLPLPRRHFQAKEGLTVKVLNLYDRPVKVSVRNTNGEELPVVMKQETVGEETNIIIHPPPQFKPGRFKIQILDNDGILHQQDFSWGVLAVNTYKSIYTPGEEARIALAVLDENGNMVCDAYTRLEITSPKGTKTTFGTWDRTIRVNPDCQIRGNNQNPDYETAFHIPDEIGSYRMDVTAETKNGVSTITDSFDVRSSVPFDVERVTATRIFPINQYDVTFRITANQDFTGSVVETVPESFRVFPKEEDGIRSFDSVATTSAALAEGNVLGASSPSLQFPFSGTFPLTLAFGERPDDASISAHYRRFGLSSHDGADYALPLGTPVVAVDDGEIILAGDGPYGTTVIIQHDWGKSYYGHLSQTKAIIDQKVKKGDEIALSGNTGFSTGPHLHFAVRPDSAQEGNGYLGKVDPLLYYRPSRETNVLGLQTVSGEKTAFVTKELSWNISVKKGERFMLGYRFDAPDVSPQFYLLGPLRFETTSLIIPATPSVIPAKAGIQSVSNTTNDATDSALNIESSPSVQPTTNNQFTSPNPDVTSGEGGQPSTAFAEARQWQIAADADVTINNSLGQTTGFHKNKPQMVFISDQTGYAFYTDAGTGDCVYSKTTDGGATWTADASEVTISSGLTCTGVVAWYDQWTPGDISDTYIHLSFIDESANNLYYQRLDTSNSDGQITATILNTDSTGLTQTDTISISKSTSNVLYVGLSDNSNATASRITQCTTSTGCDATNEWTAVGTSPLDAQQDYIRLMPLNGGNVMLIRDDISAEDIQYRIWDGSSWNTPTNAWTNIDTDAPDTTAYRNSIAATVRRWNNQIYLGYIANVAGNGTADLRTAVYNGSWTQKTEAVSNANTLFNLDIAIDEESGDVYASYTQGAADTTTNIFYKKSTDGMVTWGNETQLNTSNTNSDSIYTWLNVVDSNRIYFAYINLTLDDLFGGTVVNLTPPVLDEIMKHGEWWSRVGKRKFFTF